MSPEQRDPAYPWDMMVAAERIVAYVGDASCREYLSDDMTRDAVERNLITIGEVARKLSREFQQAHPEMPLGMIVGLRNVVVHEYGKVDHKRVWGIVSKHIPALIEQLKPLVPPVPPEEPE